MSNILYRARLPISGQIDPTTTYLTNSDLTGLLASVDSINDQHGHTREDWQFDSVDFDVRWQPFAVVVTDTDGPRCVTVSCDGELDIDTNANTATCRTCGTVFAVDRVMTLVNTIDAPHVAPVLSIV